MKKHKYIKYYFRKPRSEITKDVLRTLLVSGMVFVAGSSPYFVRGLIKVFKKWLRYPKRKVRDTFSILRKRGLVSFKKNGFHLQISLTNEGRKVAGMFQIDSLKIRRPKKWDKKWRVIIFDIPEKKRLAREALRGKMKQLGFCQLQKSVWVFPFDCEPEIYLLKDFFALTDNELRLILATKIGDTKKLKSFFKFNKINSTY